MRLYGKLLYIAMLEFSKTPFPPPPPLIRPLSLAFISLLPPLSPLSGEQSRLPSPLPSSSSKFNFQTSIRRRRRGVAGERGGGCLSASVGAGWVRRGTRRRYVGGAECVTPPPPPLLLLPLLWMENDEERPNDLLLLPPPPGSASDKKPSN